MIDKRFKLLLVFAHPDDETSACGGIIIKYSTLGHSVDVCTTTNGDKGDYCAVRLPNNPWIVQPFEVYEEIRIEDIKKKHSK